MKQLKLSEDDRMIAGVLGGIGEYYNIDSTILRIIVVLVAIYEPITMLFLYSIFAVCLKND